MTKKKKNALGEYNALIYSPEVQQISRADVTKIPPKLYNVNQRRLSAAWVVWLKGWSSNQNDSYVLTWLVRALEGWEKTKRLCETGAHLSKTFVVWGVLCSFSCLGFWGFLNYQSWHGLHVIVYDEMGCSWNPVLVFSTWLTLNFALGH